MISLNPRRHGGETLLEVLVAVVLLTSVLASAFALLSKSTSVNVDIKTRMIALNIAREGMEAVRNIRDTNWLKYSGDRRGKWLCQDTEAQLDRCTGDISATPEVLLDSVAGKYYLVDYKSVYQRYFVTTATLNEKLNLNENSSQTTTKSAQQEATRLYLNTSGRYTHDSTNAATTPFYRQVFLEVLDPITSLPTFCDAAPCTDSVLRVVSRVAWREEGTRTHHNVELETYLYDFFDRDSYE